MERFSGNALNFLALIEQKRVGKRIAADAIQKFVSEFTAGRIPDYQMAAMLMAIYFRGLDTAETTALTLAMRDSGDVLKFPKDKRPLADKHSTGGIGDKVSLPLAPLLAGLGFRVPMISGSGLGITGGTLDKLDSIPGFRTLLPAKRIVEIVQTVGFVICGQTDRMVPADKKLYALRDATGTVPSIPLITASILSKKLAESLDALVLDVKFGCAAFMKTKADARKLAKAMVALGNECGVNTRAMLTDMNTPLGRAAGNWLEVKEAVACLEPRSSRREEAHANFACGNGSREKSVATLRGFNAQENSADFPPADLRELVLNCAAHLLLQTGKAGSLKSALTRAEDCLASGAPRKKWDEMLLAQGADMNAFNRKLALDHTAAVVLELKAEKSGFVSRCDAQIVGEIIRDLGGGRLTKESAINYDVGVDQIAKPGRRVEKSQTLCRIHAMTSARAKAASERMKTAFEISATRPGKTPLVVELIR